MSRIVKWVKSLGAFSMGMLLGVCYGSTVGTVVTFFTLMAI